jgi:hypothetical protein
MITNYKRLLILLMVITSMVSCKKYLETTPKGEFLLVNYYSNRAQALTGVIACYNVLPYNYYNFLLALNSASDDSYTGGGNSGDQYSMQAFNNYTLLNSSSGTADIFWYPLYNGIASTNAIIKALPDVPALGTDTLNRYMGEAKFWRAYYYFDLVRLFKNIPLITTPLTATNAYDQVQVAPSAVYTQIEADLTAAIPGLPAKVSATENGRITQGAARALLGKVYLYEQKWTLAAAQLAQVNGTPGGTSQYGYHLLANYADIFALKNKYSSESIYEIGQSNTVSSFSNSYTQFIGPRGSTVPFWYTGGYGFNPISLDLVKQMKNDPRYPYTMINMDSLAKATNTSYSPSYQNTGYFTRKYAPIAAEQTTFGWANNLIIIRLADTYLMEAEALIQGGGDNARAQSLLDAVRARVKLPSVPVTLSNLYNERRLELAQEGNRWFDLVRTGQAATVLAGKGFKAGVNEILPISVHDLNNTKLKQNPGY